MRTIRTLAVFWLTTMMVSSAGFSVKISYDLYSKEANPAFLLTGAMGVWATTLICLMAVIFTPAKK